MPQAALPPIGAEVPQAAELPPIGGEVTEPRTPDFHSANELDTEGHSVVDPNTIGTTLRHLWAGLNPVQLGQLLPWPKAAGGSGADNPLSPPNLVKAMHAVKREGDAAWEKGDKVTAATKYVESVVPLFGPMMSNWGNEARDHRWAALVGDAGAFAANLGLPALAGSRAPAAAAASAPALTAEETASNAFAAAHDVPLDAATATGSRWMRAAEKRVASSMGGEGTASALISQQQRALTRAGADLATEAHRTAATPEQAGAGVREAMTGLMRDLNKQAGTEYDRLRAFEQDPKYATTVAKTKSGAEQQLIAAAQKSSVGRVPTSAELAELRRIYTELDSLPYVSRTFNDTSDFTAAGRRTSQAGGKYDIVAGAGGAPVYDDIVGSMEGAPTRSALRDQIAHALDTGDFRSEGAKNALEVAGRRLGGDRSLAPASLPASAGAEAPRTQSMGLAVDVRQAKQAVRPLYDALKREASLVPVMGDKARALTALDRLVNGPDHAPLSIADGALGDLKAMARTDMPELRTQGQGLAAAAVKQLDEAVRTTAAKAGPEVLDALELGRAATKGKYQVAGVLEQIRDEPVQAFRQMTAPKDTGIALLRQVHELAADQVAQIGRAKLEDWFDLATERGRFDHADRLYAEWQKLGPETKRILFGAERLPALNDFFLLAKRVGENPNPSGTAHTLTALNFGSIPVTWGLAKLLYTPRGVRALTRVLEIDAKTGAGAVVKGAAREAAWIDLASAARAAGAPMDLPKAAGPDPGTGK